MSINPNRKEITCISYASILTVSLSLIFGFVNDGEVYGQMHGGDGHNLPPSIIGDRQIFLKFKDPIISTMQKGVISLSLVDNKTGNNIPHTTYILSIYDEGNKNLFTANLHGHDGQINLEFINKNVDEYKIHANYDTLSASYVSEFGSPIKVEGTIFNKPGNYKLVAEITGIDFDNTFLPESLIYEYMIQVK